jgi:hypothetical protein
VNNLSDFHDVWHWEVLPKFVDTLRLPRSWWLLWLPG